MKSSKKLGLLLPRWGGRRHCFHYICPSHFIMLGNGMQFTLIGLRGVSDGAADLHHYDDWTQYLHVIDEKLADAVDRVEAALESGLLG